VLWGRDAGTNRAGELLDTPDGPVHVLDAHALVNATLCSLVQVPGSRAGQGSDVMHHNCEPHLRSALRILEPTIVHSQGRRADVKHPTPHRSMMQAVDSVEWQDEFVGVARIGDCEFVWVSVGHPSAKGNQAWQYPTSPRFVDIVMPALRRAYELASARAGLTSA
jgi:hypothetical protein